MIVITEVQTIEVQSDIHEIQSFSPYSHQPIILNGEPDNMTSSQIRTEVIEAQHFQHSINGHTIYTSLGVSNDARRLLGLEYTRFNEISNELEEAYKKVRECKDRIGSLRAENNAIKSASLWDRITWLVTGVKLSMHGYSYDVEEHELIGGDV